MDISIHDLPSNILASYEASATIRGLSLADFLRQYLIENAPALHTRANPEQEGAAAWEKSLDECFDSFPLAEPLPDAAFDRESIYGREDKW